MWYYIEVNYTLIYFNVTLVEANVKNVSAYLQKDGYY